VIKSKLGTPALTIRENIFHFGYILVSPPHLT
jgi:hypothetical protein